MSERSLMDIISDFVATGLNPVQQALMTELAIKAADTQRKNDQREQWATKKRVSRQSQDKHIYIEDNNILGDRGVGKGGPKTKRIPDRDWKPSENTLSTLKTLGFKDSAIAAEVPRWVDYCEANGKAYKDFGAAFRNWMTSPYYQPPKEGHGGNGHAPKAGGKLDFKQEKPDISNDEWRARRNGNNSP